MSLANRMASKIPVDGIAVEIKPSESSANAVVSCDGIGISVDCGYDIFFKFPNLGVDAVRHTSTLNLSNRAIDEMVKDVAVGFRDMIAEINKDG